MGRHSTACWGCWPTLSRRRTGGFTWTRRRGGRLTSRRRSRRRRWIWNRWRRMRLATYCVWSIHRPRTPLCTRV
ncbi:metalloendoproteinase 1 [Phtheirospermum japonicum]|uniref:Metalloendoproteinase 1 n=1 Tax=Phtheirospermum japonicum TaxID=374723 RepID=A0A830BVT0_9LAMI|nr:metalloendoproteinase 1 [Phtheirospermum japonicum]